MSSNPNDRGGSLVETMIAVLVAFIAMSSVGAVVFSAMVSNKNQGIEQTRMTVLAQEKMEELIRLNYADATTNTTLITDTDWSKGLTVNADTDLEELFTCPASGSANVGYVDWLDQNSVPGSGSCSDVVGQVRAYIRRWKVTDVSGITGLKQITVVVYAPNAVKAGQATPLVSLTTFKSQ